MSLLRATRVLRGAAEAGWLAMPHRSYDYPELKDVPMWRSCQSEAPQPILVLTGKGGLEKTAKVCKDIEYKAGCVSLELPERALDAQWLDEQVELIVKFMNVMYSPWMHVVCHSVGALVALHLARAHPARVGTLTLIDTPLLSDETARESALRGALKWSETDPNVTDAQIAEMEKELAAINLGKVLKAPVKEDAELFSSLLEPSLYPTPYHAAAETVAHPMLIIRSQNKPLITNERLGMYYTTFNVKNVRAIESSGHDAMLADEHTNVAYEIDAFLKEYSTQFHVETMWDDVKNRKLAAAAKMGLGGGGGGVEKASGSKEGKKGKKGKKKD